RSKINATDKYGKTALHYAADNGQERLVSILINQKSDFDKQDGNLDTPLHIAIKKGKSDVIHHLLEAGARTDLKNLQGRTALALVDRTINALTKSYKITQRKSTQQYLEKYQKIRLDI